MAVKALDVANLFISFALNEPEGSMTNLQVNKLIYFADGCYLAETGNPLFTDEIQAWDYGPVVKAVYETFKSYGSRAISSPSNYYDEKVFSPELCEFLIDVYNQFGKYTPSTLVEMSHRPDSPWSQVYEKNKNNRISTNAMKDYFKTHYTLQHIELDISKLPAEGYIGDDGHLVLPKEDHETF